MADLNLHPVTIKNLLNTEALIEKKVRIQGWARSCRHSKGGFSFILVNDGSCLAGLQVVASDNLQNYSTLSSLAVGSALDVTGQLVVSSGKNQQIEIQALNIRIIGDVEHPESYPIAKKRHTLEYLRTVAHLRTRTNTFGAITRLRNFVAQRIHGYFHQNAFYWINTPIITSSDCEGAGELFRVSNLDLLNLPKTNENTIDFKKDFFGTQTYLTVSGQLQLEAYCQAFSRVYTFGPTFRAENSNTSRHLAEFWMIEPEIAFANLADNIDLAEDFMKAICRSVLEECSDDMNFFVDRIDKNAIKRLENLVNTKFERMGYTEAIHILQASKQKFQFPVAWGADLQSEHERYLTETHVGRPVVLIDYPKKIKAFYMRDNADEKTVAAMDVLVPGVGELIGGGQREDRPEFLKAKLEDQGLADQLGWYLDLRRYGSTPHAGFGLGFERLLAYISGMTNVRDLIPFPRVPGQAKF